MFRNVLISSVLLIAGASPVFAQSQPGPYVGLSGGVSLPQDSRNRGRFTSDVPATSDFAAISSGTPLGWRTRFNTGFNLAGQVGYRFENGFRPELEIAYSQYDVDGHENLVVGGTVVDNIDSAILTRGAASAANPTVGAVLASDPGRVKNLGAFANLYYDFNRSGRLQPYVGAGVGVQRVSVNYRPSNVAVANDDQTRFAYQAMAGVTYKLSPAVDLFGQYNYRATSSRSRVDLELLPADLGVQSRQSLISTGIRFHFGGPR